MSECVSWCNCKVVYPFGVVAAQCAVRLEFLQYIDDFLVGIYWTGENSSNSVIIQAAAAATKSQTVAPVKTERSFVYL